MNGGNLEMTGVTFSDHKYWSEAKCYQPLIKKKGAVLYFNAYLFIFKYQYAY